MWSRIRILYVIGMAMLLVCFLTKPSFADDQQFGVRMGIYTDPGDGFIGAEYLTRIGNRVYLNPNVEYIFVDGWTFMSFNIDGHYDFPTQSSVYPWLGGGLGLLYQNPDGPFDSNTDLGLNLLFGLGFKTSGSVIPYVQGKIILSENNDFALGFGLRF